MSIDEVTEFLTQWLVSQAKDAGVRSENQFWDWHEAKGRSLLCTVMSGRVEQELYKYVDSYFMDPEYTASDERRRFGESITSAGAIAASPSRLGAKSDEESTENKNTKPKKKVSVLQKYLVLSKKPKVH